MEQLDGLGEHRKSSVPACGHPGLASPHPTVVSQQLIFDKGLFLNYGGGGASQLVMQGDQKVKNCSVIHLTSHRSSFELLMSFIDMVYLASIIHQVTVR